MSETVLKLDEGESTQIAYLAKERGYASAEDYLRALVAADALVAALRDDWQDADESPEEIGSSFREAWHAAMTGNALPIGSLWDALDDDE